MTLLTINSIDFTKNITVPSWSVSDEEIFQTWTDGNGTTHKEVTRTKVSGKFTFKSRGTTDADYISFLAALAAVKTAANAYTISVYCDNTRTTKTIDAFVEFAPAMTRKGGGSTFTDSFSVEIEER